MIESLHSPHIARVKALLSSRGKKERKESGLFIAEGLQFLREASRANAQPKIETLYLTAAGRLRAESAELDLAHINVVDVSDAVIREMGETVTPQGILALCITPSRSFSAIEVEDLSHFIYLFEIQDPGNAGTIIRTADATGFSGVITSDNSVDIFSPKVVRASAGSLWHLPVYEKVALSELIAIWPNENVFSLNSAGDKSLADLTLTGSSLWIFGNEARGLAQTPLPPTVQSVRIPMAGNAESLNLAAAAAIVMHRVTSAPN